MRPLRLARGSIGKGRWNSVAPREDEFLEQSGCHPSDPDSARSTVCLAASVPKRKPSGEPHHAHHAPPVFQLRNVGHCQNLVGLSPRIRQKPAVVNTPNADGRSFVAVTNEVRTRCALGVVADASHMISQRTPHLVRRLSLEDTIGGCLGELRDASTELDRKGFWWRPSWPELHEGKRPPKTEIREPGEWPQWASSVLDTSGRARC